ncbi:oxygen-dependent tRNA uridine(34) hydroxylase TrhO [Sphingomonas bacterium]|uniref:oxygen-dependent tRNA uridine(34) hydroxylase TrhO n=1 Tax=Sphingomonas bacterium TaxID=1895847 RepID=UPI001576856B|nr:rhodanese-related sulfurtransferase [Sphingomonas bacterium]
MPVRIVALYRFTPMEDCAAIRARLALACCARGVKGTLLLAAEGINGTIAGADEAIDHVLAEIRALPGCADIETKESRAPDMPFHRMKVRIKREIVTMGQPHIDPLGARGHYVAPQDWNMLIDQPGTILIDTRNDYEVAVGTFAGAIDPRTKAFSDFPAWFAAHRAELLGRERPPRIAMFCTGGIRCEKATAFLRAEGLEDVHHLKGGILAYLEAVAPEQSRWQGECFVFDERVAVGPGLEPGRHILCRACRMPVSAERQSSALFVEGISCPACHADRTDRQREGYAERHRQTMLAEARGVAHVGATPKRG